MLSGSESWCPQHASQSWCAEHQSLLIALRAAGMHLAQNRADPGSKQRGAQGGPRLVAFTSEQAHYSYRKAAALMGLGTDNLISVACDADGAMSPACACRDSPVCMGRSAETRTLQSYCSFRHLLSGHAL